MTRRIINIQTGEETTTDLTAEEIEAKEAKEVLVQAKKNHYATKREGEYPLWQDQLDDIYHNGVDGWKATIKVIKDKYPKP